MHYLPVLGCFATGLMYLAIGIMAILSFCKIVHGGADESSVIAFFSQSIVGEIGVWIIFGGSVSYLIWRLYESYHDPYQYGRNAKGIALRTGIALSSFADALVAYASLRILLGLGSKTTDASLQEERSLAEHILENNYGHFLLLSVGVVILISAAVLLFFGLTKGYKERLEIKKFNTLVIKIVHITAMAGFLARSIILGIIGFFYVKAASFKSAEYVVNTDKAFDFIGDNLGGMCFISLAVGTICYGLFTVALGIGYNVDKNV